MTKAATPLLNPGPMSTTRPATYPTARNTPADNSSVNTQAVVSLSSRSTSNRACVAFVTGHVGPLATVPWASGFWPVNLAGLLALLLVFPSGPPAGRGWRAVPWAFGAATVGMVAAHGPKPAAFPIESSFGELVSYGVVNLVVFAVGVGLVLLGSRVAARRTAGRDAVAVA